MFLKPLIKTVINIHFYVGVNVIGLPEYINFKKINYERATSCQS